MISEKGHDEMDTICAHCGGEIAVRNPTGNCDHIFFPDNLTDEAKRANGYAPKLTIAWMKEDVSKEEMIEFLSNPKSAR